MSKGEQTRTEIIDRALTLSSQIGLEGLSLGTLADDLRISKSGLYAHFKSKEALQLTVLHKAIERFTQEIVLPILSRPRGEPRVLALFDNYLEWINGADRKGTCFFMSLTQEFDDRPGAVRDLLVQSQRDWYGTIGRSARIAIAEGHFRADLDVEQFVFDFIGIAMSFQMSYKLLADSKAEVKARTAFAALLARCRTPRS